MNYWQRILQMYNKDMPEHEFAAFLIRRYEFLTLAVQNKTMMFFMQHLLQPELAMCSQLIDQLTENQIEEILMEINKCKPQ